MDLAVAGNHFADGRTLSVDNVATKFQDKAGIPPGQQPPNLAARGRARSVGLQHPAGASDLKEQFVAQVKHFQRMGYQQKELWHSYADFYLGGVRDPARHPAATLEVFCQEYLF